MTKSQEQLFNPLFSHIYVEDKAFESSKKILDKLNTSKIIRIKHYKDVFNSTKQNFCIQKNSSKLILAHNDGNLIYKGSQMCQNFNNTEFYYINQMINCVYNCEYCYLQGMYPSSNIVAFVNIEDYFTEVKKLIKNKKIYLCISYDTDLLAVENIFNYVRKWILFAKENENVIIEIRTKSASFSSVEDMDIPKNVIFSWTLTPEKVGIYEHKAPSFKNRILDIKRALKKDVNVRLSFDPIIYTEDFENTYKNFTDYVFSVINPDKIIDIGIGLFRVPNDYMKKMVSINRKSLILNYPFENVKGYYGYDDKKGSYMENTVYNYVKKYIDEKNIYLWRI